MAYIRPFALAMRGNNHSEKTWKKYTSNNPKSCYDSCGRTSHARDKCNKLVGYPLNHKFYKGTIQAPHTPINQVSTAPSTDCILA